MTLEFLPYFAWLNLLSPSFKKQVEVIEKSGLIVRKAVEIVKYRKNNNVYQHGAKLYQQMITKSLLIVESLYLSYSQVFLFGNSTSYSIYEKNIQCIHDINKSQKGNKYI